MKSFIISLTILPLFVFSGCISNTAKNETPISKTPVIDTTDYDKYFTGQTLRYDFQHSGNKNHETYCFNRLKREGIWAGSKKSLINPFEYGEQMFRIIDMEENKIIYQNNYSTLFNEWQTTAEAENTKRSYPESVIFPHPKKDFTIEIYARNKFSKIFEKKFSHRINTDDYNIEPYRKKYEVTNIHIGGDIEHSLDIVLLPDGFSEKEKEKFLASCQGWCNALFRYTPFDTNKHRINIRAVWEPSKESGISIPGENIWKESLLDCRFYTFGSERYQMTIEFQKVRDIASAAPYESIYIITNTDKYGGGGIYNFYGLGSSGNTGKTDEVYIHEFGHSLLGLADEYVEKGNTTSALYPTDKEPWEPNLTTLVKFEKKWKNKIKSTTPIPTILSDSLLNKEDSHWPIGVYEGGGYLEKGIYRAWPKCMMNQLYKFCPICTSAIEEYLDFICK